MSNAVKTILYDWAIPRMNARRVSASTLRGNEGSVKVFLKNGFRLTEMRENHMEARGKMRDLHILEWNLDDGASISTTL
jgi:RimJ/RimL family protein N-acetyltransferase